MITCGDDTFYLIFEIILKFRYRLLGFCKTSCFILFNRGKYFIELKRITLSSCFFLLFKPFRELLVVLLISFFFAEMLRQIALKHFRHFFNLVLWEWAYVFRT